MESDAITSCPVAATIGMFDGVHRGHQWLIATLKSEARKAGINTTAVVTFSTHPAHVLHPERNLKMLMPVGEREALIKSYGIDQVVMLEFTRQLSALSSREFLAMLRDRYGVRLLLVGYNHRFGHDRDATITDYQRYGEELGVKVVQASELNADCGHVSSSVIRRLVAEGKMEEAANSLGRCFDIRGKVVDGFKNGREIGFPTANVGEVDCTVVLPPRGAYAVRVSIDGYPQPFDGMANIGVRPTLGNGNEQSIEVHIFNFDSEIYGRKVALTFVHYLRGEVAFESVEKLKEQLQADRERSLRLLSER